MNAISDLLVNIVPAEPVSIDSLSIVPLVALRPLETNWISLEDGLKARGFFRAPTIEIEEVSDAGSVPNLLVRNKGNQPVLLFEGDILEGGKQTRTLNSTVLVPARSDVTIPVSCVEAGRWSHRARSFSASAHMNSPSMRARKSRRVSNSLRSRGRRDSNQSELWDDIAKMSESLGAHSATRSFHEVMESKRADIDQMSDGLKPIDGQVGLVTVLGGRVLACDLILDPRLFRKQAPKLFRSHSLEALIPAAGNAMEGSGFCSVQDFLTALPHTKTEEHEGVGEGVELRLESESIAGSALQVDQNVVQLSAFPINPADLEHDRDVGASRFRRTYRRRRAA